MNDLSLGHTHCSYEATEPYQPCTKQAFVHCGQRGKPFCFTHAPVSPSGRFMCAVCASIEALVLPSRCPSCGGNRIYKPWWKGVKSRGKAQNPYWLGNFVEKIVGLPQHTYTYYCATCNYHWDPLDGGNGDADEHVKGKSANKERLGSSP